MQTNFYLFRNFRRSIAATIVLLTSNSETIKFLMKELMRSWTKIMTLTYFKDFCCFISEVISTLHSGFGFWKWKKMLLSMWQVYKKYTTVKKLLMSLKNLIHISKKLVFWGKIFGFEVVCAIYNGIKQTSFQKTIKVTSILLLR